MVRSVLSFLWLALRPGRAVIGPLAATGTIGVIAKIAGLPTWSAALIAVLLLAFVLVTIAGVRLQGEKEQRARSDFDFAIEAELVPWTVVVNNVQYRHGWVIWVNVDNNGPTSEFMARIPEVTGVPIRTAYRVAPAAWEESSSPRVTIDGRGGRRRLKLASILADPRAFWFYSVQWGAEMPGYQWTLGDEAVEVNYVLEVINTGDADQIVRKRGQIHIPSDIDDATVTLVPEPPDAKQEVSGSVSGSTPAPGGRKS